MMRTGIYFPKRRTLLLLLRQPVEKIPTNGSAEKEIAGITEEQEKARMIRMKTILRLQRPLSPQLKLLNGMPRIG
jgi:hypothetical protein